MNKTDRMTKSTIFRLKTIRVVLAALFFIGVSLVFLDIHGIAPRWLTSFGLYFQFVPSLIFALRSFGLAATGFIFIILLTLLLGRVYCSSICPLGILADIIAAIGKKLGRKMHHPYAPPYTAVRYFLLAGTIWVFLTGSIFLLNLLDPFSNFGRMAVALVKPPMIWGNNELSYALVTVGSYAVSPYSLEGIHFGMLVFSIGFGILIVWFGLTRGRLYCNMICPVGTLLGLFSKLSLVKIQICQDTCNNCKRCERACKSDCIDISKKHLDYSRCVSCFNCLDICPTGAISYQPIIFVPLLSKEITVKHHGTHTRRGFLVAVGAAITLLPKVSRGAKNIEITIPNKIRVPYAPHPIIPPGGMRLDHFTGTCTGCHACIAQCPSHVLQPGLMEYGLAGLFMPYLDPGAGFCNLNCNQCGQVCPTSAITPFSIEEKKQLQVGVVKFIRDNCIVVLQKTECGACSEHCPTKAVTMVTEGRVRVPVVDEKICLGCGACEHVCPAKPNKAIYVQPHAVHQLAEAPRSNKLSIKVPSGKLDDFPF